MILADRITIRRQALDETDATGNPKRGWAVLAPFEDFPADVRWSPGKEVVEAGRLESGRTATVRLWPRPDMPAITAADILIWKGQVCRIVSAAPVGRANNGIELLIEQGGAA